MFLATLYFVLPLLGKSRPPLAFSSAESFREYQRQQPPPHPRPRPQIALLVRWGWEREVSLLDPQQPRLGSGARAARHLPAIFLPWFLFPTFCIDLACGQ